MELTAYKIADVTELPIIPAPQRREHGIPGLGCCLPLTIANGGGWWLTNPSAVRVSRLELYNYNVVVHDKEADQVASHFGFGVLSVMIPYVFSTPPGWELLIRGPSNYFYDYMHPFEGIVEADWHKASATMNWMLNKGADFVIPEGAPLAQIVPTQVATLEEFQPVVEDMPEDLEGEFNEFAQRRLERLRKNVEEGKVKYQADYPKDVRTRRRHLRLKPL
jgi:hypothetical protein